MVNNPTGQLIAKGKILLGEFDNELTTEERQIVISFFESHPKYPLTINTYHLAVERYKNKTLPNIGNHLHLESVINE